MQNDSPLAELEMQRKGRRVFVYMLIFFVVPIIVVVMMYQLNWKPNGESLGELIKPPRLIDITLAVKTSDAVALNPVFWKERWSLVYVADNCEQVCLAKLHDMRQLHASLYKDIGRAQRVLITTSQDVSAITRDYPGLIVINQPDDVAAQLAQQFELDGENINTSHRFYLVDPLGYLMMSYQANMPLADVRKDFARLLRYSWAG
jgi:cytochrome oxidase Cu insertion factor (SCO1/SenC/PrrC family)